MEETTIYLIAQRITIGSFYNSSTENLIIGFTTSKELAEYECWKLNQKKDNNELLPTIYQSTKFNVQETKYRPSTKDKTWNAYIKEKIETTKETLEEKRKCEQNDHKTIAELEESLKTLETKKI